LFSKDGSANRENGGGFQEEVNALLLPAGGPGTRKGGVHLEIARYDSHAFGTEDVSAPKHATSTHT